MRLHAYKVHSEVPELVPGQVRRGWMDDTQDRYAYRCLPLNMANVTGWELKLAHGFDATWTGGEKKTDITINPHNPDTDMGFVASSHFAHGVLTFHTNYLFRTHEGWATWAMGPPNTLKDGIMPLSGLIETDWLPFTFTMNWKFTRPGTVTFEKGEAFCFVTILRHQVLESIEPKIMPIESNAKLYAEYEEWRRARSEFIDKLESRDPETVKQSWQRHYMQGNRPSGKKMKVQHTNRRRLNAPVYEDKSDG